MVWAPEDETAQRGDGGNFILTSPLLKDRETWKQHWNLGVGL